VERLLGKPARAAPSVLGEKREGNGLGANDPGLTPRARDGRRVAAEGGGSWREDSTLAGSSCGVERCRGVAPAYFISALAGWGCGAERVTGGIEWGMSLTGWWGEEAGARIRPLQGRRAGWNDAGALPLPISFQPLRAGEW
jgi:hypothetical protein